MSRWATTVEIAGVTLTGCRWKIIDAEKFHSDFVGSATWANSGKANAQIVNVGVKGNPFGLALDGEAAMLISDFHSVTGAIRTAESTLLTFEVKAIDDIFPDEIWVDCIKDYTVEKWVTHGNISEGWVEGVIFRFISQASAS